MFNKPIVALLLLMIVLLAACRPAAIEPGAGGEDMATPETPAESPTTETGNPADTATAAAVAQLANELGLSAEEITLVSAEMTEFTDSCFGLGGPEESCLQAITPGWLVRLSVAGEEYEVRTDELGQQARVALEMAEGDATAATAAAIAQLAGQLGLSEAEIEVVSAEATEFTDGCLGLSQANESCIQAITPGWLVMLRAGGQEYEVHTDETGQQVRIAVELPEGDGAADPASGAAQEFLVNQLGVALGDVQVISAEKAEFTDSCLELGGPEESCLQAITPGWVIMLEVNGQTYEAHTDLTGTQVRIAGGAE